MKRNKIFVVYQGFIKGDLSVIGNCEVETSESLPLPLKEIRTIEALIKADENVDTLIITNYIPLGE